MLWPWYVGLAVVVLVGLLVARWNWRRIRGSTVSIQAIPKKKHERDYQLEIADILRTLDQTEPVLEHVLPDGARVDILLPTHAIEVDFAKKWAECIGQALYYGLCTSRRPTCLLLVEDESEPGYHRCRAVCIKHKVAFWVYYIKTGRLVKE